MCVLQCEMPALMPRLASAEHILDGIGGVPIIPTDIVALRCDNRTVVSANGRGFEMMPRLTKGVVVEISGPYFMVLFRSGAAGEFIRDELIRVASAIP